jgi:aldehyde dehydrogenase (NAD+)
VREQTAAAQSNLKNVTLELGGKSPLVVFEDADIDQAVELAHMGVFWNQGESCCASSRLYVHAKVYDAFVQASVDKARKRVLGDPLGTTYSRIPVPLLDPSPTAFFFLLFSTDPKTEQGPQVDKDQYDRIMGYIKSGQEEGAKMLCGGNAVGSKGFFIEPTVFADVQDHMKIAREEIFGPVMSIIKFTDMGDVIR